MVGYQVLLNIMDYHTLKQLQRLSLHKYMQYKDMCLYNYGLIMVLGSCSVVACKGAEINNT